MLHCGKGMKRLDACRLQKGVGALLWLTVQEQLEEDRQRLRKEKKVAYQRAAPHPTKGKIKPLESGAFTFDVI